MIVIIALIVLPSLTFGQTTTINTSDIKTTDIKKEVVIKKVEKINLDAKALDFDYKKSKDLTSVKAYIRSLQLKRKQTLAS